MKTQTTQTQDTNIVSNIVGGFFGIIGTTIGATAGAIYDTGAGIVDGVSELPNAIVDGFQNGIEFGSKDEPDEPDEIIKQTVVKEADDIEIQVTK